MKTGSIAAILSLAVLVLAGCGDQSGSESETAMMSQPDAAAVDQAEVSTVLDGSVIAPAAKKCGDTDIGKSCCCKSISGNDCRKTGDGCDGHFPVPIILPVTDAALLIDEPPLGADAKACGHEDVGKSCCCKTISGNDCRATGSGCGDGFPIPILLPVMEAELKLDAD